MELRPACPRDAGMDGHIATVRSREPEPPKKIFSQPDWLGRPPSPGSRDSGSPSLNSLELRASRRAPCGRVRNPRMGWMESVKPPYEKSINPHMARLQNRAERPPSACRSAKQGTMTTPSTARAQLHPCWLRSAVLFHRGGNCPVLRASLFSVEEPMGSANDEEHLRGDFESFFFLEALFEFDETKGSVAGSRNAAMPLLLMTRISIPGFYDLQFHLQIPFLES